MGNFSIPLSHHERTTHAVPVKNVTIQFPCLIRQSLGTPLLSNILLSSSIPVPVLVMTVLIQWWRFPLPFMWGDSYFKSQMPCSVESEESFPLTQAGGGGGGAGNTLLQGKLLCLVICKRSLVGTIYGMSGGVSLPFLVGESLLRGFPVGPPIFKGNTLSRFAQ